MKKLLTAILLAASVATVAGTAEATRTSSIQVVVETVDAQAATVAVIFPRILSNCGTGVFYNASYAYGAQSWCNSGTGTQRIRIKCYVWNGGGTWYTKNGPYVTVTKTSAQWCNGQDMLMDKWIQHG